MRTASKLPAGLVAALALGTGCAAQNDPSSDDDAAATDDDMGDTGGDEGGDGDRPPPGPPAFLFSPSTAVFTILLIIFGAVFDRFRRHFRLFSAASSSIVFGAVFGRFP